MESNDWVRQIRNIIAEKLFVEVDSFETDLFEIGVLDSLTLVELVLSLEKHFRCRIDLAEVEIGDFRSIARIAELVARARAEAVPAGDAA